MNPRNPFASALVLCLALVAIGAVEAGAPWPQWGGPDRDFTVEARKISRNWGEGGPPVVWERPLGAGFASIVGDERRLFTAFRDGDDEIVVALNRKDGKTLWEYAYAAPVVKSEGLSTQYGEGPNGTPLIVGRKLVVLGFTGQVHCLDARKGKLLWSHDLAQESGVRIPYFGHATSPLAVGDTVVIVAGGVRAFDLDSGELIWENTEHEGSYGSPRLVNTGGSQQIVTPLDGHLAAFDATSGKLLWSEEHKNQWGTILTSPLVDDDGHVFISAAQVGSILVDPAASSDDGRRLWESDSTQINHSNAVLDGEWVFASAGGSASFVTATSLEDGSQAWKERGFAQANLLKVGDAFLLLDFDGQLAIVELSGEGMKVVTQASINDERTWTPPTLIGTTLYVRDESRIQALDLSSPSGR
jgi:outer membrane protein assembly factor BamB